MDRVGSGSGPLLWMSPGFLSCPASVPKGVRTLTMPVTPTRTTTPQKETQCM